MPGGAALCERKVRDFCEYLHFYKPDSPISWHRLVPWRLYVRDMERYSMEPRPDRRELLSRHNLSSHPEGHMYHLAYQSTQGMFAYDKIGGSLTANVGLMI